MESYFTFDHAIALLTLSAMEIVLGIDNVVFLAILVAKLPLAQQARARRFGILLALFTRLGLLFSISWLMGLTRPLFEISGRGISGRDLILLVGGLFLIAKATREIHERLESGVEPGQTELSPQAARRGFVTIVVQIAIIDIVFSLDSVITAVGMASDVWVMVVAMVAAMLVMLAAAGAIGSFVDRHPTIKVLALSFLILIGVMLLGEGLGLHVGKGYVYFAMAFSLGVEFLNMRLDRAKTPIKLRQPDVGQ